jgi:general secretion pathway protein H
VTVGKALRQMSPTGSIKLHEASAGFLLLDLALALTIALILFSIVWSSFGRGTNGAQQMATAVDIATLLRADRNVAIKDARNVGTRIDLTSRTVRSMRGRYVSIPADLTIEVATTQDCMDGSQRFTISFAPDGKSCGGLIILRRNGNAFAVRINWLSGMIDVVHFPKA